MVEAEFTTLLLGPALPKAGLLSPALLRVPGGFKHYCAGCRVLHYFPVDRDWREGNNWECVGQDWDAPTFRPGMMWRTAEGKLCHYELTFGYQAFKLDCTHVLAGREVPLLPIGAALISEGLQHELV